jgi:O-glycosyl hydrolase
METGMKAIILLLTTTALVAGASQAFAMDRQASDEAVNNGLSHQAVDGFGGAYGWARPDDLRNSAIYVPRRHR